MKKRLVSFVLLCVLLLGCTVAMPVGVMAETEGGFTYTVEEEKAEITGCAPSLAGAVSIPETLGGYPVCSIGNGAFNGCTSITSIQIPRTVTRLGITALVGCTGVTAIEVEEANPAFASINGNLYTKNGKVLIRYASGKKDTSFAVPSGVIEIGGSAFYSCASLTTVSIPKTVETIGSGVFRACVSLAHIAVEAGNPSFYAIDGNLYRKVQGGLVLIQYAIGQQAPAFGVPVVGVVGIGAGAFYGCTNIRSVMLPSTVVAISQHAFDGCTALESMIISSCLTRIEEAAFYRCQNLKTVFYRGNETQWKAIVVGASNENLQGAKVQYNFNAVGFDADIVTFRAQKQEADVAVTLVASNVPAGATVYVAAFQEDGVKELQKLSLQNGRAETTFSVPDAEYYKAFIWGADMKPLAKARMCNAE